MAQKKIRTPADAVALLRRKSHKSLLLAIHMSQDLVARHFQYVGDEKKATSEILRQSIVRRTRALVIGRKTSHVQPTRGDEEFTQALLHTGRAMGICLLDHILVKNGSHYSFKENGRLFTKGSSYRYSLPEVKKWRLVCG